MKLQKLVISGFGPYALRQELDFENNLKDKNMFVITGNTGAGKTTIFDAINFALYGEASGSERDGKSLRSDFADPETPTEVELWFSLRGKEYYIKRSPSYMRPKQRGEGYVESKSTAEIRLSKDKTITGINDVTREVERVLGITSEQFKQLVMIPQGEFKRLLLAKNEEKEDIFRKIFGTEVFENTQKQIKKQALELESNIRLIARDRLNKIRSFQCKEKDEELFNLINVDKPNIEFLMNRFNEFIEGDNKELGIIAEDINLVEERIKKLSTERDLGTEVNNKFVKEENYKKDFEELNNKLGDFDIKKELLNRGKKALNVKAYESKYTDKKTQLEGLRTSIVNIEKKLEVLEKDYEASDRAFKIQQGKEEEKNKLNKDKNVAESLREKVSQYEDYKKKFETLTEKVNAIKNKIGEIGTHIESNDNSLDDIKKEIESINKAKEAKGRLLIEQNDYKNKEEKLDNLKNAIKKWNEQNKKHQSESENYTKLEDDYKNAKTRYEAIEEILRRNQAGILAAGLEEGTPCPVCGSTHHVALAKIEGSGGEVTEESVKKFKEAMENARIARDAKHSELAAIYAGLTSIKTETTDQLIKELFNYETVENVSGIANKVEELIKSNNNKLLECEKGINTFDQLINSEGRKIKERDGITALNNKLSIELQSKNDEFAAENGKLKAADASLDIIKSEFKGDIISLKEIDAKIETLDLKLGAMKKEYDAAEKALHDIKSTLDQEKGNYKTTKELKESTEAEEAEALKVFEAKLMENGFKDADDYENSCLTQEKISEIEEEINSFNTKLEGARSLYGAALKEIEGLSKVDLTVIVERLKGETSLKEELQKNEKAVFARVRSNSDVYETCKRCSKEIEGDEKKYEVIGKLSNIINGDNSKKINFERYVLAAYFEDIIGAANLRFNKMTSGRFELLRKIQIGDKRKGQGLDLEVFDNYTGKARDIITLSGGESFKASLSMALGLADVVQAYAGGIQLDTMFIDEGFGTLDPESLDNAVECLVDLQNDGRLVGVISHVAELKERIPARLEVSATNKGSVAVFRV